MNTTRRLSVVSAVIALTLAQATIIRADEDHAWLATSLEHQADSARAIVMKHESMAQPFRAIDPPTAEALSMIEHCDRIVTRYREKEASYRAEAAEHRAM
jgi:hypothetical protein